MSFEIRYNEDVKRKYTDNPFGKFLHKCQPRVGVKCYSKDLQVILLCDCLLPCLQQSQVWIHDHTASTRSKKTRRITSIGKKALEELKRWHSVFSSGLSLLICCQTVNCFNITVLKITTFPSSSNFVATGRLSITLKRKHFLR